MIAIGCIMHLGSFLASRSTGLVHEDLDYKYSGRFVILVKITFTGD